MDFGLEIPTDGPATVEMVNAIKESFDEDDLAKFHELLLDTEKPLYKGCPDFTKLSVIVKLLNLKGKYIASDKFFTELLGLLKKMLPAGVDTYDDSTQENFNLYAVVLWAINDYPVLGTLCGFPYNRFKDDIYHTTIRSEGKRRRLMDKKSVGESLVRTLLNVLGKTKDGMNARLDLAELGIKPELFTRQEEDKTTLPPIGYTLTNAKKTSFVKHYPTSGYHRAIVQISLVERELAISKDSVSKTVRWISYRPRATIVKYEAYNINGYTFHMKCNDGIVYQNSGVSVEAVDLHISKEVSTIRKSFYYGVLQEIWVLDYHFRQIPLFRCDWVNHKTGGVKYDPNLGYTLVDLNSLGHNDDLFILASQARQVFYVKD
nr:hypothetical protein [Tanacetum cinerariifolium]